MVSSTPVSYTPNVFAGTTCGTACNPSTVYSTAVVGSEVVVAGAFTQACTPAPATYAQCPSTVTADYIFAFDPSTGAIDPNFAPALDQGPVFALVAGPNDTVYAGGAFTTVNGVSQEGLDQLFVTPGQPTDGQTVPGFNAQMGGGHVRNLALNGNALYAGGTFKTVDGVKLKGIARLNATTGALDSSFQFTLGTPTVGASLQVQAMSLTPDGSMLAIGGSFQSVNGQSTPRIALINTGGGLGSTATLDNWSAPILTNNCAKQHNYVNGIDFSPDGSFFVVVTTGFHTAGGPALCDTASRFETGATGTSIQPTWINYSGADSFDSVAVAGTVAYVGGHERWLNNECGQNHVCESNSVLVDGIGAIDTQTGLTLPWWQPGTRRGNGVASLNPYPAGVFPGSNGGLLLGTDVNIIGGSPHSELAMFPLTNGGTETPGGSIPSGMFSQGRIGGTPGTTDGVAAMCIDDAGNGAAGDAVQLATCDNGSTQNWTIEPGGTIQINSQCLDTAGEATTAGTLTVLGTCNGSSTQVWTQAAGNTLVNQGSGLCLDDPGASTTDDTQLQINPCDGTIEQTWPLPVAQAPPPPPATGPVYSDLLQKDEQVPCMEDMGNKAKSGNKVQIDGCLEEPSQEWTLESDGTVQIHGLCLEPTAGGTAKGTLVVIDTCDGAATQIWAPGANYGLINQGSNKCLTDPTSNTVSGTQLIISPCTLNKSQEWRLPNL
ncbi:MAG TPA: ricin-type beta-trefoil lectin domain protein [Streptosporangiaceae bacterium]